jgi:Outer membrane protein beta-barrel domain
MTRTSAALVAALVLTGVFAPAASADTFFTPFAGVTFGGDASPRKFSTGASLTFMGHVAGFEIEFGYTPDFFGEQTGFALISSSNVTTLMGNVVVGPGAGPVRPYVEGGVGLLRSRIRTSALFSDLTTSDWGLDAGGGVIVMMSPHTGVSADLRYFRRLQDPSANNQLDVSIGTFHYWRFTGGLRITF